MQKAFKGLTNYVRLVKCYQSIKGMRENRWKTLMFTVWSETVLKRDPSYLKWQLASHLSEPFVAKCYQNYCVKFAL